MDQTPTQNTTQPADQSFTRSRGVRLIGTIFLCFGIPCLIGLGFLLVRNFNIQNHGVRVVGTVTGNQLRYDNSGSSYRNRSSSNGPTYHPEFSYPAEDGRILNTVSGSGSWPPAFAVGQQVTVVYPHGHPEQASILTFTQFWLGSVIFGGFGVIFTAIGLFILISGKTGRSFSYTFR